MTPARDLTGAILRDSDDKPLVPSAHAPSNDKPTSLSKGAKARQAERVRALTAEGYTVLDRGSGLTVFRFGER
jgi:hypothetical protein